MRITSLSLLAATPLANALVVFVDSDAFMETTTCHATPCRRRKGAGEADAPGAQDTDADTDAVSDFVSSSAALSSTLPSTSSPNSPPTSSSPASSTAPTPIRSASSHSHTDVGIALGAVFGVLVLAGVAWFAYRRHRRRRPDAYVETPSPPYTPPPARPPSMRERRDHVSDTHTAAGTPLTRSSFLTSLSSNSMGLAHLSALPHEKRAPAPSSLGTASILETDCSADAPPPEYETSH
ncbi:hypothetical protein C8R46DRAFT_1228490 [Mycena filopes]|nr:hypothetical protein C8R46DRAFT_1228490 [Mycena filopes]